MTQSLSNRRNKY
jgi:hypothetical protein